ncbi:ribose-phosphate pyrophosphokinase-like domain-containing protein (plasmid) [Mesorhizobium atlanticum]|uniref:ribose-phosphate pyrophosphokinase-like domain-containing protein n=1 Tax=Mesorhizobium atlanticum TaxID=2233532 RepID=UPI003704B358
MTRVLLPFPLQRTLADALAPLLGARTGRLDWRHFPDGESLVTIEQDLHGADVALVASLRSPDELAMPLLFAAATAREFGARSVGLVAPYLAYMRQDKRFNPGEAVSAPVFTRFLTENFDWLVTADPHLHRNPRVSELFRIPARAVATAPLVAEWIRGHVPERNPDRSRQ